MRIKVTADSTCDLSPEMIRDYDITIFSLYVRMGEDVYQDGVTIHPQDIFSQVEQGAPLPATAAVNSEDYRKGFAELSPLYDAVIHISLGSGFSSCCQNATIAAEEFPNVYVIDSANLSTGQGLVVMEAVRLSKQGLDGADIAAKLNELVPKVEASFLLDRLDYMQKGGRCSMVAMLGANLLRLKPCIEVQNGEMKLVEKFRGPFPKCISEYCRKRLENRQDLQDGMVFITHPDASQKAVDAAREAVETYGNFANIYETHAGCTISSHCGPNTLGILFIRK